MDTLPIDELQAFIVRAKRATYVGSGGQLLPYRLVYRVLADRIDFLQGRYHY